MQQPRAKADKPINSDERQKNEIFDQTDASN